MKKGIIFLLVVLVIVGLIYAYKTGFFSDMFDGGKVPTEDEKLNCGGFKMANPSLARTDVCTLPLYQPIGDTKERVWTLGPDFDWEECPQTVTPALSQIRWYFNQQNGDKCFYVSKRQNPVFVCDKNNIGYDTNGNARDYCECDQNKRGYDVYGNKSEKQCGDIG